MTSDVFMGCSEFMEVFIREFCMKRPVISSSVKCLVGADISIGIVGILDGSLGSSAIPFSFGAGANGFAVTAWLIPFSFSATGAEPGAEVDMF